MELFFFFVFFLFFFFCFFLLKNDISKAMSIPYSKEHNSCLYYCVAGRRQLLFGIASIIILSHVLACKKMAVCARVSYVSHSG